MLQFSSLVQKAQSLIEPSLSGLSSSNANRIPSKASLFREQFRLPDSQNPLHEISAELVIPLPYNSTATESSNTGTKDNGTQYAGELHLSESFLCFSTLRTSFLPSASHNSSTNFTGQTHGAGPAGNGFTLPLCAIRRVERQNSQSHIFSLALTTWAGFLNTPSKRDQTPQAQKLIVQLVGSRQACERFCDGLKRGLREGMKEVESLRTVVAECYSDWYLDIKGSRPKGGDAGEKAGIESLREAPDAGLGMIFRYPGDPRKSRNSTKMRLWRDYMRGLLPAYLQSSKTNSNPDREWSECDNGSPASVSQDDQGRITKPFPRRDMGTHIWVTLLPIAVAQIIYGNSVKERWTRLIGY